MADLALALHGDTLAPLLHMSEREKVKVKVREMRSEMRSEMLSEMRSETQYNQVIHHVIR